MGQARKLNVNSDQYRGPMPDNIVSAMVQTVIGIDAEWMESNKPSDDDAAPIQVPDEKQTIEWRLVGLLVKPSRLLPRDRWPTVQIDLGVVKSMTVAEFLAMAKLPEQSAIVQPGGATE